MIAYVSFQELATQVAHRNTGQALDKTMRGKKIMSKVAGDEGLHHAFYRDLVLAALEIDASTMVMAIQSELRNFKMPGTGIPGFTAHEEAIALAGIFGAQQFVDAVVRPTISYWGLLELEGLSAEADRAREKIAKETWPGSPALRRLNRPHRSLTGLSTYGSPEGRSLGPRPGASPAASSASSTDNDMWPLPRQSRRFRKEGSTCRHARGRRTSRRHSAHSRPARPAPGSREALGAGR